MNKNSWDILWETRRVNGLYSLNLSSSSNESVAMVTASSTVRAVDPAMKRHAKTRHIGADRYIEMSHALPSVPFFTKSTLMNLNCVPCLQSKARRARISPSENITTHPLELVHIDISGPVQPSLAGIKYTLAMLDDFTGNSDVFMLKTKDETYRKLEWYRNRSQTEFNNQFFFKNIRLDCAGENKGEDVKSFAHRHGIKFDYSPAYASESNGAAERLIKEHWAHARVLLFAADLPLNLWGEAINHGNWLRNRAPSQRLQGGIPILAWNANTRIDFEKVPEFGQKGHAFVYRSKTTPQKKLLHRTSFGHFVGMEGEVRLFRVFVPATQQIIITRAQDFHEDKRETLPGFSSLMDGISREMELSAFDEVDTARKKRTELEADLEEQLLTGMTAITPQNPSVFVSNKTSKDPSLPRSFSRACEDPAWAEAIDREFNALVRRQTWKLIPRTPDMRPVPYTWVFKLKPLNTNGHMLHKARCVVRGDQQKAFVDYDPFDIYAPVAAHETLRLLLAFAASHNLGLEGADISNAYLYGTLDIPIIMEQPTDSTGVLRKPSHVCELRGSMYGTKKAGKVWGSLLGNCLHSWNFKTSRYDPRLYLFRKGEAFILVAIVVDDFSFASNSTRLMSWFKRQLSAKFDIKLFGCLKTFIGWEISHTKTNIRATQSR